VLKELSIAPFRRTGEWIYRSMFYWPRGWLEAFDQLFALPALPPGNDPPIAIRYEAGWAPEPVWTRWWSENSCPYRVSISDPSAVQPVASRYSDCAIPSPVKLLVRWLSGWLDLQTISKFARMQNETWTNQSPDLIGEYGCTNENHRDRLCAQALCNPGSTGHTVIKMGSRWG
jgi:hypothetical protein